MGGGPQISLLSGDRLHLHQGPIDIVLWAEGMDADRARAQAVARFDGLLDGLAAELPGLRRADFGAFACPVAQAMGRAVVPFRPAFITPMAAVAGAVADAILAAMVDGTRLNRAYVNNGGDIALYLAAGQRLTAAMFGGRMVLDHADGVRGVATSGWGGRSFSLGIADSVTVVARTAAMADAAATMIANAVDLPGHPAISRVPAQSLQADCDLGARMVTVGVGPLGAMDVARALDAGMVAAQDMTKHGLIAGAALFLQSDNRTLGSLCLEEERDYA